MGILFIISVAALLALLWAAFSIARHIRRARKRQRNAIQAVSELKRESVALPQAEAQPASTAVQIDSESDAKAGSTRDWAQLRYSPPTFTAEQALNRKA